MGDPDHTTFSSGKVQVANSLLRVLIGPGSLVYKRAYDPPDPVIVEGYLASTTQAGKATVNELFLSTGNAEYSAAFRATACRGFIRQFAPDYGTGN